MKFNKIIFVILLMELFCFLSVTSGDNLNNARKCKKHIQRQKPSVNEENPHTANSQVVSQTGEAVKQDYFTSKLFPNPVRNPVSRKRFISKRFERPNWSSNEAMFPRPTPSHAKPQYPNIIPMHVNPRQKINMALRKMDYYLKWNKTCSMKSLRTPSPPNFRGQVKRISEAKCLEYIWNIKADEEIDRRLENCRRRNEVDLLRIPNGIDAGYGEFPHMGAVGWLASDEAIDEYDDDYIFMCGSTLISENFALTASHCAEAPSDNKLVRPGALRPEIVRFGVEKLYKQEKFRTPQDAVIAAFISHPRRDVIHRTDDLALIKFEEPVYFTNFVRPACIVPESFNKVRKAIVSGWGVTKRSNLPAKELQKTDVDLLLDKLCNEKLRSRMRKSGWHGLNRQMCATNLKIQTDACQGDSGGPLQEILETKTETTVYNVLGVVAFNFVCASTKVPSIYTKIDNNDYMDWIEEHVWGKQQMV